MDNNIFVDEQGVILLDGQTANVELDYNPDTDQFVVIADCENWAESYRDFVNEYYPDDDPESTIKDAEDDCKAISGSYNTLGEVNDILRDYCDDWYEFILEYEDDKPVE